jgi:hypothetical protein
LLSAIGLLALLTVAGAADQTAAAIGKYKWVPAHDLVSFYKRHRLNTPSAVLWLNYKGVFRHVLTDDQGTETTLGTYRVEGDKVVFHIESGDGVGLPRSMDLDDECISGNGTAFLKDKRIKLPMPERPRPQAPIVAEDCPPSWVVGTWTLRNYGNEDISTRFTFSPNGTFRYKGLGGTSAGTYEVSDSGIELVYCEIDGTPVEGGTRMRKFLPAREHRNAFMVDTYRYEKSSR